MAVKEPDVQKIEFSLDLKSGVPYYKQIIMQVELAIADGRLISGEQLPTVRNLAVDLRINPNTVAKAYNTLELRGIVTTQQGTGTFISEKKFEMDDMEREKILSQIIHPLVARAGDLGFDITDIISYLEEMQLRAMNMVYEGLRENKGSLVMLPSSALDSMNLGTTMGLASLAKQGNGNNHTIGQHMKKEPKGQDQNNDEENNREDVK